MHVQAYLIYDYSVNEVNIEVRGHETVDRCLKPYSSCRLATCVTNKEGPLMWPYGTDL